MAQAIRNHAHGRRPKANGQRITSGLITHPRHFRGRQHAAAIVVIVAVAVCAFRLFPTRSVTVLNGGETYEVSATFDARNEALAAASISLGPGDVVRFAGSDRHSSLAIQRAKAVTVEADGAILDLRTQAATVEGALADAGIALLPGDRVYLDGHLTTGRGPLAAHVAASRVPVAASQSTEGLGIRVVRARPISLVVDDVRVDAQSSAPNVQSFLLEQGLTVREGDLVQPTLDATLAAGMTVRLAKARTISVVIDGKEQSMYTLAPTVADVFKILGIEIGPEDVLSVPASSIVTNQMTIALGRTIEVEEERVIPVPSPVVYESDPTVAYGQERTIPGADGEVRVRERVIYKAGVEQSRTRLTAQETLLQPVPTRVVVGTKGAGNSPKPAAAVTAPPPSQPAATAAEAPTKPGRTVLAWTTWYNESHGAWSRSDPNYGLTASGKKLERGLCAVDPHYIPLGTMMIIPGYGRCIAADTGGAINGYDVDLGFPESEGDPGWGAKYVEITILD